MRNKGKALWVEMIALGFCFTFGMQANATTADTTNSVINVTVREMPGAASVADTQTNAGTQTNTTTPATGDIVPTVSQGYGVAENAGALICTYDGQIQKNVYLAIKKSGNRYQVVKPLTKNSEIYYFDQDGNGMVYTQNRFVKVTYKDSVKTYFSEEGSLVVNTIAGNKAQGYYYVDDNGVKVTSNEMNLAVKFVRSCTKSNWPQSKKLRACYDHLWKNYTYERFYDSPNAAKMSSYAKYMLTKKRGNCFRYAASFAYIAKTLGYDVRVAVGEISSTRGGMTPHGWTEIKMDGKWYMFDANMQRNYKSVSSYKKTDSTYAYRHREKATYKMTVKNGKVSWKK